MSNALFIYRNRIDSAIMSQSSAAIDADDGSPLGAVRLQDPMLARVARTTRSEFEWWRATWPEPITIDTVALWKHNGTPNGEIPLRLFGDAAMTQLLYSGTHYFWPSIYGIGEQPLDEMTIGGVPLRTELDDDVPYTLIRLGQAYAPAVLDFGMRDPGNPDYRLDGGRLIAGVGLSFKDNFELGWTIRFDSSDKRDDLDGGGVAISRGASWRVVTLTFQFLTKEEGNTFVYDLLKRVRLSAELLAILHPGQFPEESRTAIYGVFNSLSALRKVNPRLYALDMEIREIAA